MPCTRQASLLVFAIASLASAQTSKSPPPKSPLQKGIAHFDAERLEPAKAVLAPLATAGDPEAMYYLGRIAIEQSQNDQAIEWLEQAIKKNDASSRYHQWLSAAYSQKLSGANAFSAMSMAPTMKKEMLRAVELDSSNVDARVNLTQFYIQAPAMVGGGMDKAREEVAVIARMNPYQGRLMEASIAEADKDTVVVLRILGDLAKAFPDSAQPTVRLSLFYSNAKRYDDAFKVLETRLKLRPDEPATLYQLGRLGAISGQNLDRALAGLNRFLKMPHHRGLPSIAAAHWRLGMVMEAKGDKITARKEYETALRIDPELAGAKASLEKIK